MILLLAGAARGAFDITNTAYVDFTNGQGVAQPPALSTTTFTVTLAPLLTLIKSASATDLAAGQDTDFLLTIVNTGTAPALNVTLIDSLPQELGFQAMIGGAPPSATAAALTWNIGTVNPGVGGTVNYSFRARAQSVGADAVFTNRAAVYGDAAGGITLAPAVSATSILIRALAAPGVPGALTAIGQGDGVLISWAPAAPGTFGISGYTVYRATYAGLVAGPGTFVSRTWDVAPTSFTDPFITSGVRVYYTVRAIDATGLESGSAPVVSVLRPLPVVPLPPTGGPVRLVVEIFDAAGRLVRTVEDIHVPAAVSVVRVGDGSGHLVAESGAFVVITLSDGTTAAWDGRDAAGAVAPNGLYTARVTSILADGRTQSSAATFTVTRPYGTLITAAAMVPNPADQVAWIAFALASPTATLDIKVYGIAGELVHAGTAPGTAKSYRWPLKNQLGTPVADGMYVVVLEAFDPATGARQREIRKLAVLHKAQ